MPNARFKDISWPIPVNEHGGITTWEQVQVALLMDIRDELQTLNIVLRCPQFQLIPHKLDAIRRNTTKKRRPKRP